MKTIKLYEVGDGSQVIQLTPTLQYHLLNGAVLRSNITVENLPEAVFDINTQVLISNAVASVEKLVCNKESLEILMSLIQEKIEDFD
jgi:hypothetical protein